jgi:hypothetical protein
MPFCGLVLYKIRETNYEAEEAMTVDDPDVIAKKAHEMTVNVAEDRRAD